MCCSCNSRPLPRSSVTMVCALIVLQENEQLLLASSSHDARSLGRTKEDEGEPFVPPEDVPARGV
eukprot:5485111-Pyramimonas_sp.AAC.1